MYVKRKSNWYIYFIAFGTTLVFAVFTILGFKAFLFPEDAEDTGLNKATGELSDDFEPTHEHDFSLLAMLSDGFSSTPDFFYMVNFNAVESQLVLVPLPPAISVSTSGGMSLQALYTSDGSEAVTKAVEKVLGLGCDSYIKMDKTGFIELIDSLGIVEYVLPKTIIVKTQENTMSYNSGVQYLSGESIYQLMIDAEYDDGELYRFRIAGEMLAELINQNYNDLDSAALDRDLKFILDNAETNVTQEIYLKHKAALLNTIMHGISPAEFYIPYGEYTADGFEIAENSLVTIKQKAGKE